MKKNVLFIIVFLTVLSFGQTKIESSLSQYYDGTSWLNSNGYDYSYDDNGNLISEVEYYWDSSNSTWKNQSITLYNYNTDNKVVQEIYQYWDGTQYINSYKTTYSYNSAGSITQMINQNWNGTQWENESKSDFTYDNGKILVVLFQDWNGTQWINNEQSVPLFIGNNLTNISTKQWDGTQWNDSEEDILSYNSNNKVITWENRVWNGFIWDEEDRTEYTYDANGNRSTESYYYLGNLEQTYEYNYDLSASINDFYHPFKDKTGIEYFFEGFPYVNKLLSEDTYYDGTLQYKTTYNYESSLLSAETLSSSLNTNTINIYPNPANEYIKIGGLSENESIKIYSNTGNLILEKNIEPNEKIDIQKLSDGLYFIKLKNGKTLKFIKK
ncbi:MAG: T9SS type A sorting domain-containing protein [Flavobacteriales bacterium]|nr:T9SS type A sorting domain-containing protein [Flavobacteriales bacterium]